MLFDEQFAAATGLERVLSIVGPLCKATYRCFGELRRQVKTPTRATR
ncbi:hypothetical protein DB30_00184 [Enhygromyxa salina]|uniref:Uncharacterized protein n=1 Tax=Enhygromyxa salina TaxID=215803 RepID=A0A0C1ZLV8_9BACT|nr:hypothetical protein DB30_00184 [Enhygromyxa salina]